MTEKDLQRYKKISKVPIGSSVGKIKTTIPKPVEIDYRKGFIKRYFAQKTNDKSAPIYEIDDSTFTNLRYKPNITVVSLKWRISGPKETQYDINGNLIDKSVSESNRIAIKLVSDKIPNLKLYLPNLLQFHK
jgi:hypothetical protein